jgi:hypothetical protein
MIKKIILFFYFLRNIFIIKYWYESDFHIWVQFKYNQIFMDMIPEIEFDTLKPKYNSGESHLSMY